MSDNTHTRQTGLSLIELMIAMALGTLLVLGITRYAIDAMQTQRTTADLANNQDAVRITLEKLRREIQRAGFSGCNNITSVSDFPETPDPVNWQRRQEQLQQGVAINGNSIDATYYLTPLLAGGTDITISANRTIMSIPADAAGVTFQEREDTNENRLILANCYQMELIDPPAIAAGSSSFTLANAVNSNFFNLATGEQLPGAKLYIFQEATYAFDDAANTLFFDGDKDENILLENIAADGYTITETGTRRPNVNIQIDLVDNLRAEGVYTTNVQARNKGI